MKTAKMSSILVVALGLMICGPRSALAGEVVAWGQNDLDQCVVTLPNEGFVAVAGGAHHSLGLKANGSIAAWGDNQYSQCDVPLPNEDFIAVSAGGNHSLGLKADGSIVAWGNNHYSQCNVPLPNEGFIAVAGGNDHSLGLKADGSIAAWGYNNYGQCDVPLPNEGFIAVSAGGRHNLGLKADGSIVAWGFNGNGECSVPLPNEGFIAVAGGSSHSLGLKTDGSIVGWGYNGNGQCNVPLPNEDFVAVAGGRWHSLGLKADGSIMAWGYNNDGQCDVPLSNEDFVAVAGGDWHSLGLKGDPMGAVITYQGRLLDTNSAADGLYDLEFRLYDSGDIQHGNTLEAGDVDVIDGYFTVELDFGTDVFDGSARWLQVGVRPGDSNDPNAFVTLSPRQEITASPYALHALNAPDGHSLDADDGSPTDAVYVDNNGNVGIGTSSPISPLTVKGVIESSIGGIKFPDGTNQTSASTGDGHSLDAADGSPTDVVYVDNAGNVGIGTVNPQQKLGVNGKLSLKGATYSTVLSDEGGGLMIDTSRLETSTQVRLLPYDHDIWLQNTDSAGDIYFSGYAGEDLTGDIILKTAGNVGIGTMSPTQKLDVAGNITVSGTADVIGNLVVSGNADFATNIIVGGTVDGVDLSAHAANANAHHTPPTTLPPSGPAGGDLSGTYPNPSVVNDSHSHGNGTVSDNISINNGRLYAPSGSGNVGIGTTAPARQLDLQSGQATLRMTSTAHQYGSVLELRNNTAVTEVCGTIKFMDDDTILGQIECIGRGYNSLTFDTASAERVRIDSAGNVGIGTTSPTERLQVAGNIDVSQNRVKRYHGFPGPDYDSGWVSIGQGSTQTLSHNVSGSADKYVVDIQSKDTGSVGINNRGHGGDRSGLNYYGVYWHGLTNSQIKVTREDDNEYTDQVRIRIWVYD